MTIKDLRLLALHHAEQAMNLSTAAAGLGPCGAANDFREKADWHRLKCEQLKALADEFDGLVRGLTSDAA